MKHADILVCPNCDYKRHLTEAQACLSAALVVACLRCGTVMQCDSKNKGGAPETKRATLEPRTHDAQQDWVLP